MDYRKGDMGDFLQGPECRKVCTLAAGRVLAKARGFVGKDSGGTAASGHLVHGRGVKGDRVMVSVVFEDAAVEEQFGNERRPASRFLTKALEGE